MQYYLSKTCLPFKKINIVYEITLTKKYSVSRVNFKSECTVTIMVSSSSETNISRKKLAEKNKIIINILKGNFIEKWKGLNYK